MSAAPGSSHWFEGGCHCGAVRFRVRARAPFRALECNCTICTKKGIWHLIVERDDFELVAGEEACTVYQFGTKTARHTFCRTCGIHPFYTPRSHPDGVDVNVRCLDGEAHRLFSIEAFDGKNWEDNVDKIASPHES